MELLRRRPSAAHTLSRSSLRARISARAVLLLGPVLVACSGGSEPTAGNGDAAADVAVGTSPIADASGEASTIDATASDAGEDAEQGEDAGGGSDDGGVDAHSTGPIYFDAGDGGEFALVDPNGALGGWTSDGALGYASHTAAGAFYALDVLEPSGNIVTVTGSAEGRVAIPGTTGIFTNAGETLGIWTSASGYHQLSTSALSFGDITEFEDWGYPWVQSPDGSKVAYFLAESPDAGGADAAVTLPLVVQGSDGTSATVVAQIPPQDSFLMTATNGLIVSDTVPTTDGGTTAGIDLYGGSLALLGRVPAAAWGYHAGVDTLYVVDGAGNGSLVRTSDGLVSSFDSAVGSTAIFDAPGANLYYTAGSALKKLPVATPASPSTLVASGATQILAVSPDGNYVLFQEGGDDYVEATSGAGSPTLIASGTTVAFGFFTADSSTVVAGLSVTYVEGFPAFPLSAVPVTGGAPTATVAQGYSVYPLSGTLFVYEDATYALHIIDAAGKVPTQILVSETGDIITNDFAISPSGTQIAWMPGGAGGSGLYEVTLK